MRTVFCLGILFICLSCQKDDGFTFGKTSFNQNWIFTIAEDNSLDETYLQAEDFSTWDSISLPHTPKIEPLLVNNQFQGISFYKKEFCISKNRLGKKLFLEFEGAMNIAEVWVNGKKMLTHQGGYLPFVVDISEVVVFDKRNSITVKLNNNDNPITGPKPLKTLDFNTYGGIYRNVWLIEKNPVYITHPILENKTASGGVFVTYEDVSDDNATVHIQTHIKNENASTEKLMVKNELYYKDQLIKSVESEFVEMLNDSSTEIKNSLTIDQPKLWSPEYPNLYQLKTEIIQNEKVVDSESHSIGIKTMNFVGQDFYLNGEKTFLRGVNRHQEYPYVGYALSDEANYRDAKKIKDAGFDYVRLSHYPQSPSFMDACDELGLVTINAILGWQYFSEDKAFQEQVYQTARDLIRRDRNRASVMAWEVSLNESWMPEYFIDNLVKIAKEEYPTDQCFTAGWQDYGYDIYLQARQHRLKHYDSTLTKPYNVSEYGDWEYYAMNAGLNQDSWSGLLQQERSSRQLRNAGEKALLQQATNIQEAHNDNLNTPAFADGYWAMFDYNRGYAEDLEASGIMDIFRLPKPSYYFYQSQRDHDHLFGEPMVFIANQWKADSPLDVRIFSNCDEVELFLNGKSLGKQKPDANRISNQLKHPPFTFSLSAFEAGHLEAKAYINGSLEATHSIHTPEKADKIELEVDLSGYNLVENDMVFVYAKVVDKNGTLLTNFNDFIQFKVEGNAELIGENPVKIEAGIASILLKTKNDISDILVKASTKSGNLAPHKINLKTLSISEMTSQIEVADTSDTSMSKPRANIINQGNSEKKQIALTFDDGPTEVSKQVIDLLNANNAKATFFWLGKNLNDKKAVIKMAMEAGHQIENHSWDHKNGLEFSNEQLWENQVNNSIQQFEMSGIPKPNYYRPPFGAITDHQVEFLLERNIKTVLWSITTMDWDTTQNREGEMFEKFQTNIHNGAIVLLHDFDFGNVEAKLKDLEEMLKYGTSQGYSFVSINDIF